MGVVTCGVKNWPKSMFCFDGKKGLIASYPMESSSRSSGSILSCFGLFIIKYLPLYGSAEQYAHQVFGN